MTDSDLGTDSKIYYSFGVFDHLNFTMDTLRKDIDVLMCEQRDKKVR